MSPITYLKTDEETTLGDYGRTVVTVRILFKVGDHGPFLVRVPKEGYTAAAGRAAVEAYAREIRDTVEL